MSITLTSVSNPVLLEWSGQFITTLSADPPAYGVTAEQCADYTITRNRFADLLARTASPDTDTKSLRIARNEARTTLENATRTLVDVIQAWPPMTDEKRARLKIHIRDRIPTRRPRPSHAPLIELVSQSGRTLHLKLIDRTNARRRGRPVDVIGASILSFAGEVPPDDVAGWTFEGNTTRVKTKVVFPVGTPPGAKVWVTAVWYNTRAESGPPSAPVGCHIAGGLGVGKADKAA